MKTILITGGGGFIGRNLILRLVAIGGYRVICLDQRKIDFYPPEVRCETGTFSDRGLLEKLLPGVDVVVHLGSNALPANSNYVDDVEQNLLGSITLIKACEDAHVGAIVFASSGGTVYGPNAAVPTPENAPLNPICSYGIIKVAVEHYLALATRLSGMRTVTLRIANPYGPWQNWNSPQGAIAVFCHKVLTGQPIELFGDGSVSRDFVYIDDVVEAMLKAIEMQDLSGSINIGSGGCCTLNDVIGEIESVAGMHADIVNLPSRGCDVPRSYLDIGQAKVRMGWTPMVKFRDGIVRTIAWQRANTMVFG